MEEKGKQLLSSEMVVLKDCLFLTPEEAGDPATHLSAKASELANALGSVLAPPQPEQTYIPVADLVLVPSASSTPRNQRASKATSRWEAMRMAEESAIDDRVLPFSFVRPSALMLFSGKGEFPLVCQPIPPAPRRLILCKSFKQVAIFNENGEDITRELPVLESELRSLEATTVTMEAVRHGLGAIATDLLYNSGDIHGEPAENRLSELSDILQGDLHHLSLAPVLIAKDHDELTSMVSASKSFVLIKEGRKGKLLYPFNQFYHAPTIRATGILLKRSPTAWATLYEYRWGLAPGSKECTDVFRLGGEMFAEVGCPILSSEKMPRGAAVDVAMSALTAYDGDHLYPHDLRLLEKASKASISTIDEVMGAAVENKALILARPQEMPAPGYPRESREYSFSVKSRYSEVDTWLTFHFENDGFCEGWTLNHANPGILKFPVRDGVQAAAKNQDPSNFKIDLSTGEFARKGSDGSPISIMSAPRFDEPTSVLSSDYIGDLDSEVATGRVEYGARKPFFREYFLTGPAWKGRYLFRMLSDKRAYHEVAQGDESTPFYWTCMKAEDPLPYVLSDEAQRRGWLPPLGSSALPQVVRDDLPPDLAYWEEENRDEALAKRELAAKYLRGEKGVRQVFGTSGGKKFLVPEIIPRIPEHTTYVEPFCGGAAIFFAKEPSKKEVLGDVNDEAILTYQVLKEMTPSTKARLEKMDFSYSPANFKWATTYKGGDPILKFRRWIFMTHMTYGGRTDRMGAKPSMRIQGKGWGGISRLDQLHERLAHVELRCADYKEVMKEFDAPDTFHYLDPPYTGHAEADIGRISMVELAKTCKSMKGKWMISCMDNDVNRRLFEGSHIIVVNRGPMGMADRQTGDQRRKNVELLIANFPLGRGQKTEELPGLKCDITVKQESQRIVGGPVYTAKELDSQGEWTSEDAIQDAMYAFMEDYRAFNVGHKGDDVNVTVLECFQAEKDTEKGGGKVSKGTWWLTVRVNDDDTWAKIESGELRGFSWEGIKAVREAEVS